MGAYSAMINDVFDSVKQAIGIHVMMLVVERALWKTRNKYEEASLTTFSQDGIVLDGLKNLDSERAKLIAHSFMMNIITTSGHLVGKQLASQLTEQIEEIYQEG
jgi:hypothetical protein